MVAIETEGRGLPGLAQLEPSDGERLRRLFFRLSRQIGRASCRERV